MMKRIFLIMLAVCTTIAYTSCSDDKKEDKKDSVVAGTYSGYSTESNAMMGNTVTENQTITISADGMLTFVHPIWGTYTVSNMTVTGSAGNYSVEGSGKVSLAMNGGSGSIYDYTMTGTVVSTDDAEFTFAVSVGAMGTVTIVFHTGDAPDETV